jgi:hypothetical protein
VKTRVSSLLGLALVTSAVFAATPLQVATPTISAKPAVSGTAVDSVVDDLQGIVVLCATQPKSQAFTNAWTRWLRDHPNADVEVTINEVLRRANTTSSMTRGFAAPGSYHVPDRRIAEHMRVTARSIRLRR